MRLNLGFRGFSGYQVFSSVLGFNAICDGVWPTLLHAVRLETAPTYFKALESREQKISPKGRSRESEFPPTKKLNALIILREKLKYTADLW